VLIKTVHLVGVITQIHGMDKFESKMVQDSSQNTTNKVVEYLLLRQHVSALALGHHQVSNCAPEETIQCSIGNEIY